VFDEHVHTRLSTSESRQERSKQTEGGCDPASECHGRKLARPFVARRGFR
jgi:hypothetical protein